MLDALKDLLRHTNALGFVDKFRVDGTDEETTINALSTDGRSVVIQATLNAPMKEFNGTIGFRDLPKLNIIANLPVYEEDAKIAVTTQDRNGETIPVSIHFENSTGDFTNDFRFMPTQLFAEELRQVKFKGAKWNIEFAPSDDSIQRFKYQRQANPEVEAFMVKTDDKNLMFYFGDKATSAGDFVFQANVEGKMSRGWAWPVAPVMSILSLPGAKTIHFSDDGCLKIDVQGEIALYEYILRGLSN